MEENPFKHINLSMKGFPLAMKHTPFSSALPNSATPLIEHVLAFFETLLVPAEAEGTDARRKRGNPGVLTWPHLWLAALLALFRRAEGVADLWRLICLSPLGSFAPVQLTQQAVRQRLLSGGLAPMAQLLGQVNESLQSRPMPKVALHLASFAKEIVALDESTLDAVARLCDEVAHLAKDSALLRVGKLAGLFDVRRQCWLRLQFRSDVYAHCKTGAALLLEGLQKGSLILADLGYFGFAWFDYLTEQGYYWISRLKPNVSFERIHVFFEQGETLDALIWLGVHRSDQAAHAVRLVQFRVGETLYQYVTNVCDPHLLPMHEIAQLYARRWDIELAFKLLKQHLGLRLWWGCDQRLVMQQIYLTLIVAQVLHHLQLEIAAEACVDPFDVSLPILITMLTQACLPTPQGLVTTLVEQGRFLKLIRPHGRLRTQAPIIEPHQLHPAPPALVLLRRARHTVNKKPRHPRTTSPFDFRFLPRFLI
jgi:plasmid maintenance system antidote protein VapI